MNPLTRRSWSPYLAGLGIGLLSWFTFAAANKPIGVTTPFEHTAALAQEQTQPEAAAANDYFEEKQREGRPPRLFTFEWMLVLGIFIGALFSSLFSGDRDHKTVPQAWEHRFGPNPAKRFFFAFVGGMVLMFGARLAQGCTSGHGISGTLQLAVSSWVFILAAFLVGSLTAFVLYGREGRRHV